MALPSSRYDQDDYFDEKELDSNETYFDLINESILKNSKITISCLKKLLNRKDCFIIVKKEIWKTYADFNDDFEKVINKTHAVDYLLIPSDATEEDKLKVNQWAKFQLNTINGDQYAIIGGIN